MQYEFKEFPKIFRFNREVVVSEKIDGTNAQILIEQDGTFLCGSRNKWIVPGDDNAGFAKWAHEHKDELITLGPGQHFGEWWGAGIQRRYGMKSKVFSLFNAHRWSDPASRPACCNVVPILWRGLLQDFNAEKVMADLKASGSIAAPGFMDPEGIVVYHTASNACFKKTFDDNHKGQ